VLVVVNLPEVVMAVLCIQVDVLVTTAGGIEEDLIKCLAPTYMGDFAMQGAQLRSRGLNRIGNLLVPNDNYCKFEDWVVPILDQLLLEQKEQVLQTLHNIFCNDYLHKHIYMHSHQGGRSKFCNSICMLMI
jgi:deoxyhypusine synthase